jgi:hypothetical protein
MALLCHNYPSISPTNIWDLDIKIINQFIAAATREQPQD